MTWHLIYLWVGLEGTPVMANMGEFERMDICFAQREEYVEKIGKPIVNYQFICVADTGEYDERI